MGKAYQKINVMTIKTYNILRYDTVKDDKIISQESTLKEDTTFYEVIVNK